MSIDIVRGELERLFSLDEMMALSTDLLGMKPSDVGGDASKASFARALTDRCVEIDAVEALVDAVVASRQEVDPRVRDLGQNGGLITDELRPGDAFGPFVILKKIGEGSRGIVYATQCDGVDRTLKVFRRSATSGARATQRFLTHVRLAARVTNENLPADVEAGTIAGRAYVSYAPLEGQPLGARIGRTGPLRFNEAKGLLRGVLNALGALHDNRLAHGAVRLENIIMSRGADGLPRPVLVDVGGDRLSFTASGNGSSGSPWGGLGLVKTASPEQLHGRLADPKADLYAFGALMFEVLSGKPLFPGGPIDVAIAHLTQGAPALSSAAPRGWITQELDDLVGRLLEKEPEDRPADVRAVLSQIEAFGRVAGDDGFGISQDEMDEAANAVVEDPTNSQAAMALEATVERGADPGSVAQALVAAALSIESGWDELEKIRTTESKKQLLFRAARIYDSAKQLDRAEEVYAQLLEIDAEDDAVVVALEEIRKTLGKHDELVEMLLERSQNAESHTTRARALNHIGHLYLRELDDKEQAVFAFAQALGQHTLNDDYAVDLERSAGQDMALWAESLQILSQASTQPDMPAEAKIALFTRLGRWYSEKIARPDLGLPCFQAVLSVDPAHEDALEGLTQVYRRAQQWEELGQVLLSRADRAATPDQARNLRVEAAEVLETKFGDQNRARDLYEQIFAEDPGNTKATDALGSIYQRLEDWAGYSKILERRAQALRGDERLEAMCKIAELNEDQRNDLAEATRRYEAALEIDPYYLTALRGLDRIYNRTGKYQELLENLERQIAIAATPRQKINLYERVAGIFDEEFLDHVRAAESLEAILAIDPGHEGALTALVRHYRVLDRWEDVVYLYEQHLKVVTDDKRRLEILMSLGRVLVDQVGSPERARQAYEKALEIDSNHAGALESLASVRAATGDAMAALSAVESLAAKAGTPESRADLWIRAAKILEEKGDRDGGIERYKAALDAQPGNPAAATALRAAYLARGDANSAVELILRQIDGSEGTLSKARLYGEMAQLLHDRLGDSERAKEAATKAVDLDPTSMLGLLVTGDIAFDAGRFIEASKAYESLANRADALRNEDGVRLLIRYVDALSKSGSTEKAIGTVKTLLALAPDDPAAIARAGKVQLDAGNSVEAAHLFEDLVTRFGDNLENSDLGEAMLNLGLARLQSGDVDRAIAPLNDAADLAPESAAPINALCKVFEAKKDWEEVVRIKTRRLDIVAGEERSTLLLEIGEVLATQIGDRTRAAKSYVAALDERPDDRRILTKLMQLYSEEKDWSKLIEVVLKLASKVEDPKQKAKYLHTAAIVSGRQLQDFESAIGYYEQVLKLDPTIDKAFTELVDLKHQKGDHEGVERLLKREVKRMSAAGDNDKMLVLIERLGLLYLNDLGWTGDAIDAYEAAQTLDPDNDKRNELLAQLYASDPAQYLDKAVAAQASILRRNPYKPDAYKLLRKLYTESKRADAAWCICQALFCMNFAEPDEERFFRRMRADGAVVAESPLSSDDWEKFIMHDDADPLLTAIFATIEPAVLRRNGQSLEALGYDATHQVDLSQHPYPMSQTLYYACSVLGMRPPLALQNATDPGGISFLHAHTPAIVLGAAALAAEIPAQAAAFIAARHIAYYRPGLYLRHLVPTGTGLRAWLFAAIKLITPAFPIAKELDGPVKENLAGIEPLIVGSARDRLASSVTKLLQAGAIDLKKWVAGVDLSADRAGFIVANDMELAHDMIKGSDESSAGVAHKERAKELALYGVSEAYFSVRKKLGINIDA